MRTRDIAVLGAVGLGGIYLLAKSGQLGGAGISLQPALDKLDELNAQLKVETDKLKARTTPEPLARSELGIGELAEAERLGQGFSEFIENVKRNWASGGSMGL
jgi:hypothetical protein